MASPHNLASVCQGRRRGVGGGAGAPPGEAERERDGTRPKNAEAVDWPFWAVVISTGGWVVGWLGRSRVGFVVACCMQKHSH